MRGCPDLEEKKVEELKKRIAAFLVEQKDRVWLELPRVRGNIPVITVRGQSLAEAWELSLLALFVHGTEVRTEYDKRDSSGQVVDPPSLDASMRVIIEDPSSEPLIHRGFPGGLEDLEEYRQEVLEGIKDHWVRDPSDPDDKRWEYTYHERLFSYRVPGIEGSIDQIEKAIEILVRSPITRRCQAITWKVWEDADIEDPACLQSIWFRILPDEKGADRLNMNVRFRSRDAYDAAFMNCFAFVHLQEHVAAEVGKRIQREVRLGRYVDESDSYHIYGRRIADFAERFLGQFFRRAFEDRTWTRAFALPFFEKARPGIKEKVARVDAERAKRKARGKGSPAANSHQHTPEEK